VRALAWRAATEGIDVVAVPLFANDPLTAEVAPLTLTHWGIPPGATRLYLVGDLAGQLLAATRPLLMSGRDA
jgi:hypothetical protein